MCKTCGCNSSSNFESSDLFEKQKGFIDFSYAELEEMNLETKRDRMNGVSEFDFETRFLKYLEGEKGIKALTICFTDIEGKLQLLDYDKKYLLSSSDNLTFDGSSIRGFTAQKESDLRLKVDWSSFRWMPADVFGSGKVLAFAHVYDRDGKPYETDFRYKLAKLSRELRAEKGIVVNVAPEIEGFVFKGVHCEETYDERKGFELATMSGYFNCLPKDPLRLFIDKVAEVQRALGFENEKDHPEVAPAQFELNYKYTHALDASDQIQLYKITARQVAKLMGFTACFLPKPVAGINGSGMHTNISLASNGKNMFYDVNGEERLSKDAHKFLTAILNYAKDLCLVINSSVNAYRRLDPHFEAPNEIKVSAFDRGSMIRIPVGNEKSARIEVRTVAPDSNPYLFIYTLLKAGFYGMNVSDSEYEQMKENVFGGGVKKLPGNIYTAIECFSKSEFMKEVMGEDNHRKFLELKKGVADRCPRELGTRVKAGEVLYHHEITNQILWGDF